jgi:hypothetical protein
MMSTIGKILQSALDLKNVSDVLDRLFVILLVMIQADDKIPWSTLTIDGVTEKYNREWTGYG